MTTCSKRLRCMLTAVIALSSSQLMHAQVSDVADLSLVPPRISSNLGLQRCLIFAIDYENDPKSQDWYLEYEDPDNIAAQHQRIHKNTLGRMNLDFVVHRPRLRLADSAPASWGIEWSLSRAALRDAGIEPDDFDRLWMVGSARKCGTGCAAGDAFAINGMNGSNTTHEVMHTCGHGHHIDSDISLLGAGPRIESGWIISRDDEGIQYKTVQRDGVYRIYDYEARMATPTDTYRALRMIVTKNTLVGSFVLGYDTNGRDSPGGLRIWDPISTGLWRRLDRLPNSFAGRDDLQDSDWPVGHTYNHPSGLFSVEVLAIIPATETMPAAVEVDITLGANYPVNGAPRMRATNADDIPVQVLIDTPLSFDVVGSDIEENLTFHLLVDGVEVDASLRPPLSTTPDNPAIAYNHGRALEFADTLNWTPDSLGHKTVRLQARDSFNAIDEEVFQIEIRDPSNPPDPLPPTITNVSYDPSATITGNEMTVEVFASDPDSTTAQLTTSWSFNSVPDGATTTITPISGNGAVTKLTLDTLGTYTATITVTDEAGLRATSEQTLFVIPSVGAIATEDFSAGLTGGTGWNTAEWTSGANDSTRRAELDNGAARFGGLDDYLQRRVSLPANGDLILTYDQWATANIFLRYHRRIYVIDEQGTQHAVVNLLSDTASERATYEVDLSAFGGQTVDLLFNFDGFTDTAIFLDDIEINYSGFRLDNEAPVIQSLTAIPQYGIRDNTTLTLSVTDADDTDLSVEWELTERPEGSWVNMDVNSFSPTAIFDMAGTYVFNATVDDGNGSVVSESITLIVDPISTQIEITETCCPVH